MNLHPNYKPQTRNAIFQSHIDRLESSGLGLSAEYFKKMLEYVEELEADSLTNQ